MKLSQTFHLGLCMAGSVTAGAYTAGVLDYLIQAMEEWEKVKANDDIPGHQVVIDLLCGSSGGGMTGAMTLFALMDKMDHAKLEEDGISYKRPGNNILWNTWVELNNGDMVDSVMSNEDISPQQITSLLNSSFIDTVANQLQEYIAALPADLKPPPFLGRAPEMFMTLFNVTGINYELRTRSSVQDKKGIQYISDHRDLAHFRWTDLSYPDYQKHENLEEEKTMNSDCDGRIPISLTNRNHIPILINSAKATGAFPVGLKARLVERPAKFIWDNPFFHKENRFNQHTILLGEEITGRESNYISLNSDGGTANNEPVELARQILLSMRNKIYKEESSGSKGVAEMSETEKVFAARDNLVNTSVLLIDPFPSLTNEITVPDTRSGNFPAYAWKLIKAMNSQLIFDAKDALDAYKKENYGLHIVSPSKENVEPKHAIACGAIGGFGGFLSREFRVHDFFLGRKNCQSFLRKYFVARLDEPDPGSRACVQSIIDAYQEKPLARDRFAFQDEKGIFWLPVIPDVTLIDPIQFIKTGSICDFVEGPRLPLYQLEKLPADFLQRYSHLLGSRFMGIANNLIKGNWFQKVAIRIYTSVKRKKLTAWLSEKIMEDLSERGLVEQEKFKGRKKPC